MLRVAIRIRPVSLALGLLVLTFMAGCSPIVYRAETELSADGKLRRAIYQPITETPADALRPERWEQVTYAERMDHTSFDKPIHDLPLLARTDKTDYFAAWGTFKSAAELPNAFRHKAPEGIPDGQLLVEYTKTDCVFVIEHRWRETLTDVVTLDDMHLARQQFFDMLAPLIEQFFVEAYGEEYDTSGVAAWLRATGKPWFFEMADVIFETGARQDWGRGNDEQLLKRMEPVCARYRLKLRDDAGKFIEGEAARTVIESYARRQLQDHLRRRDGEKVPDAAIDDLLEWVGFREKPENREESDYDRFKQAVEKVVAQNYGGNEAFEEAIRPVMVRMLGLYAAEFLGSAREFEYTMTMPAPIIETNGLLLSDRKVQWKFEASEAYPFGRSMECRALELKQDLVQSLLKNNALEDRAAQLKFVKLVGQGDLLKDALQDCVAEKSFDSIYRKRDSLPEDHGYRGWYNSLLEVLKLPGDLK